MRIQPHRSTQKEHIESFQGRLRDEWLNTSYPRTPNDVRTTVAVGVGRRAAAQLTELKNLKGVPTGSYPRKQ